MDIGTNERLIVRDPKLPYTEELLLENADDEPLEGSWTPQDRRRLGLFAPPPLGCSAAEGDGKGAVVTVTFAPTSAGRYVEAVPVYVNERGASSR